MAENQDGARGEYAQAVRPEDWIVRQAALGFALLAALMVGLLVLANFLGSKIWALGPAVLDAGILVFPIIYIVGDLLVELYGREMADRVAVYACVLNGIAAATLLIAKFLPGVPGAQNVELMTAYGLSVRVFVASIIGFFVSRKYNSWKFEQIRARTLADAFWRRSLGSSWFAHVLDAVIFNVVAFAGRMRPLQLLAQVITAVVAGFGIEALLNPLTKRIAVRMYAGIMGWPKPPIIGDLNDFYRRTYGEQRVGATEAEEMSRAQASSRATGGRSADDRSMYGQPADSRVASDRSATGQATDTAANASASAVVNAPASAAGTVPAAPKKTKLRGMSDEEYRYFTNLDG